MEISCAGDKYVFFWALEKSPTEPEGSAFTESAEVKLVSAQHASMFLRRWGCPAEFRRLLRSRYPQDILDEDILNRLALELAKGGLRVVKRWRRSQGSAVAVQPAFAVPRRPAPSSQAPADPPSTFDASHDGEAQAAVLVSAAQDGSAICEECERRRAMS